MCGVQFLKEMDVEIRRNFDKERDVNIEPRRQTRCNVQNHTKVNKNKMSKLVYENLFNLSLKRFRPDFEFLSYYS